MTEHKLVRSCLSEILRSDFAKETPPKTHYPRRDTSRPDVFKTQPKQRTSKRNSSSDVGSELQAIMSCTPSEDFSHIFGCSPPARSSNPLSRDYRFRSCALVNPNLSQRSPAQELLEVYAAVMPEV